MLCYNDAWLIHEPLAPFYLSTNTFRNPLFNNTLQTDDENQCHQQDDHHQRQHHEQPQATPTRCKQNDVGRQPVCGQHQRQQACGVASLKGKKWNKICDNLKFSLRDKAFVLELNFKRRLHDLRRYLDKNLPWILPKNIGSSAGGACRRTGRRRRRQHHHQQQQQQHQHQQQTIGRDELGRSNYYYSDDHDDDYYDDKFWKRIEPNSAKSLGVQQEKILSRLERAKKCSQRLFNMERSAAGQLEEEGEREQYQCQYERQGGHLDAEERAALAEAELVGARLGGGHYVGNNDDYLDDNIYGPHEAGRPAHEAAAANNSGVGADTTTNNNNKDVWLRCLRPKKDRPSNSGPASMSGEHNVAAGSVGSTSQSAPVLVLAGAGQQQQRNGLIAGAPVVRTKPMAAAAGGPSSQKVQNGLAAPEAALGGDSLASTKTTTSTSRKRKYRWISRSMQIRDAFNSPKKLCIVCYMNTPNIVTLPCKHHDICSDCFIEIIYLAVKQSQYPLRCVLCRQKIERIRCSRRLLLSVIEKNRNNNKLQ